MIRPHSRSASVRRWVVLGGPVIAVLLLLAALELMKVPPPAGVSADEWTFCTERNTTLGGPDAVEIAGTTYLGWDVELGWGGDGVTAADVARQPGAGLACRIANELYGLRQAEWDWCFDEANRAAFLAPAVAMLGMGEDEAINSEGFSEAPGDDPVEYGHACRFAYQYWREQGISEIVDPVSHPFFALTGDQQAWCAAADNRHVLEWVATQLGIETPEEAPPVQQRTAYVRACRLALLAGRVPAPDAARVHVRDEEQVFSPEVRAQAEARLAAIEESTGFVGVFVTERTTGELGLDVPAGPEVDGQLELRFPTEAPGGCCAMTYSPPKPRPAVCCPEFDEALQPVLAIFNAGRYDDGVRAFLSLVDDLAGEPEPLPRRLPAST